NGNFVDNVPTSDEYYYALRAVDDAGNTSSFSADQVVVVVPATPAPSNNQNQVGAQPNQAVGTNGNVQGETTTTDTNGDGVINEDDEVDEDGDVLGEDDENEDEDSDNEDDEDENGSSNGDNDSENEDSDDEESDI